MERHTETLVLTADISVFPVLREWLEKHFAGYAIPVRATQQLLISADEIFTNIASYAYAGGAGTVEVTVGLLESELQLSFSDWGIPFDPLAQKPPKTSAPVAERTPGGLGILLVRKMMDKVEYRRIDHCNHLILTKKIGGP